MMPSPFVFTLLLLIVGPWLIVAGEEAAPSPSPSTTANGHSEVQQMGFLGPPPFIQGLSEEQRKTFFSMKFNMSSTKGDINDRIQQWVQTLPTEMQDSYTEWQHNITAFKKEFNQRMTSNLSTPALELFTQIQQIMEDPSLTYQQTCEKVQSLVAIAKEEIRKELKLPPPPYPPITVGAMTGTTPTTPAANGGDGACHHGGPFGGDEGYQHKEEQESAVEEGAEGEAGAE